MYSSLWAGELDCIFAIGLIEKSFMPDDGLIVLKSNEGGLVIFYFCSNMLYL